MTIYEISCATSLTSSSSIFDTNAQDMCQFDLSFAPKDLFIVAGSKIFRHCIFQIVCTLKGIWKFTVMYFAADRIFYETRMMIEHQGLLQNIGITWFI